MPGNPEECRAHARRCWALAAEVTNPVVKKSLTDLAQRWAKVAADLEVTRQLRRDAEKEYRLATRSSV